MTPFPSWQETFLALHRAATLEELRTVLLVPHSNRSSSAWEEPFALFRRFHADDAEHAAITVALLCTDHRWRTGVCDERSAIRRPRCAPGQRRRRRICR